MTAEYKISSDAPYTIIIEGTASLQPFVEFMGGTIIDTLNGQLCEIAFTKENAEKLRTFLRGKDFEIPAREKALLARLADDPEALTNENLLWSLDLTELRHNKAPGRFTKIKTEWDLIHYMPLRYLDKTNPQSVNELEIGSWAVIAGTIAAKPDYNPAKDYVKFVVADIKGNRIAATFFRQKWMAWKFKEDDEVILYGNYSEYVNHKGAKYPQISNPKMDKIGNNKSDLAMIPIYPQKSDDKSWQLKLAQEELVKNIVWIEDPVPERVLKKHGFISRTEAYTKVHFPNSREDVEKARQRIAFDEFVRLQMFLQNRKKDIESNPSGTKTLDTWANQFVNSLPFSFTGAQERVITEILADMKTDVPMYRLLQGDVGSGKTEISSVAALVAAESGYQVALLAPTDILAGQLFERLTKTFAKADLPQVKIALINGRVKGKARKELLEKIHSGEITITVGTHAILQKDVVFKNLGLAIIDEQHKLGVQQRTALMKVPESGLVPDMLSMSATPIPRTSAQIVYGDLDISIVDELPAERIPIKTEWHETPDLAWVKIREEVEKGNQAYVVATLVEDSDALENIESAEATYQKLKDEVFPDLKIGLLHGRLPKDEKNATIRRFEDNEFQILVATSVVEVGVNIPNATVMTILNANRFGISSLHQIRGRVGRGALESFCYLVGEATTPEAEERLNALVQSNDGFWLAEKDLEIRGEGSLFGQLQSGANDLFIGNLKEHKDLLEIAKTVAKQAASSVLLKKEVKILYEGKEIHA